MANQTVMTLGESALTGWRGAAGRAVARPVARRTRFSEEQVRAIIGLAVLAYAIYRIVVPSFRAVQRDRRRG
jgi:copper oxidase (laccase) domain-containing protein